MLRVLVVEDGAYPPTSRLLDELITPVQAECDHYALQLVERIRWAIADARARE